MHLSLYLPAHRRAIFGGATKAGIDMFPQAMLLVQKAEYEWPGANNAPRRVCQKTFLRRHFFGRSPGNVSPLTVVPIMTSAFASVMAQL